MYLSDSLIAYSLPGSSEFIIGTIAKTDIKTKDSDMADYDFIIAPFDKAHSPTYLVKFSSVSASRRFTCQADDQINVLATGYQEYAENFSQIKSDINSGTLSKTILSRTKIVSQDTTDLYQLFVELKNKHANSFCYLLALPELGVWLGVSPESLLKQKDNQLQTKAVAGTQSLNSPVDQVLWGTKEIEEHAFIEQFLRSELDAQNIEYTISPTYTIAAGAVCHISSDIAIESTEVNKVLDIIHPGPALSGLPKQKSIDLINKLEQHDRKLYCGYLGPITKNHTQLFANIRCMEVYKDAYCLYVGGGITKDSELQKEWEETELKSMTLLSAIENAVTVQ